MYIILTTTLTTPTQRGNPTTVNPDHEADVRRGGGKCRMLAVRRPALSLAVGSVEKGVPSAIWSHVIA